MFSEIGAQLGINSTIYFQFGLIVFFYFVVSNVYLKPFQRLFEKRELLTDGALNDAKNLITKTEELKTSFDSKMKQVNGSVRITLHRSEEEAKKASSKILDEAAQKARTKIQEMQKEVQEQKNSLMQDLEKDARVIADEIVVKLLGA